nr:hypothetical protein [Tanacetum cinerariifolium]
VEDKILVPKPPKNCARCSRCGYWVDGPHCQGCALLREKLKENMVSCLKYFHDTSESSDDSTNVVNAPREPFVVKQDHGVKSSRNPPPIDECCCECGNALDGIFCQQCICFQNTSESSDDSTNVVNAPRKSFVVKQDHGSFVDKIICDLNKAPDSPHLHTFLPNQFYCFHCKDVLGDGEACQRCTCKRCGSGLGKGLCYICRNNQNSLNDSPSISANSSHNPSQIDECCCECGNVLDGIFCQQCICKFCGKGAHIGYNCPPKVSIISNPKPCNQTMNNELPQSLPDVLGDGEACQRCTCKRCGSGLSKGLCYICGNNQNSLNDSQSISGNSSHNPPHIDECCCECGNALDGIFFQQCTCKSCEKVPCVSKPNFVDESSNIFNPPSQPPIYYCEFYGSNAQYGHYCTPQAPFINSEPGYRQDFNFPQNIHDFQQQYLCCDQCGGPHETFQCQQIPACCDDDDDYNSAITPVLSIEEPDNSLSMGDEHLDTIPATESDEVIKSSVEDLVPILSKSEGIPDTIDDDSLYKKNIEYVEASPHNSELVSLEAAEIVILKVKEIKDDNLCKKLLNSSSTSPKSFLEETNTFHNSLPEFENFCFDLEEISSGSTTTDSDISLPDYKFFYFDDDHIEEISGGSTTTHSDISLSEYDSFIFDLSNDQFPPSDRSDLTHKEFVDKLTHIISPPEYDCFYFRNFPDPGELMSILYSGIRKNPSSTTCVNLPIKDDHSPLLAYVVWIFLAYLTYPVIPSYLHPFENEDTIFDPGITINRVYSFKPGLSYRCGAFKKFNTHRSHLNEWPMIINGKNTPILDVLMLINSSMGGIGSSIRT